MFKKIEDFIRSKYMKAGQYGQFVYHIDPVRRYALDLAKKYKANKKIVEISALFHDIARIKPSGKKGHEIAAAAEAEKTLKRFGYSHDMIEQVKYCILCHRHSKDTRPKTIEAKILRTADAMNHFETVPFLIAFACNLRKMKEEDAIMWVYRKLERDWHSPMLPEGRKKIKKKYLAAKLLFEKVVQ